VELTIIVIVCAIVLVAFFFSKILHTHHHKKYHHKYSYIQPISHGHKSGWTRVRHASRWVKARVLNAPDYNPVQGIHYYPYCRGRHFEYIYDGGDGKIYKRRLRRH